MTNDAIKKPDFGTGEKNNDIAFTSREMSFIDQIHQGKNLEEMAEILKISKNTVHFYLTNIRNKLNLLVRSGLAV